MTQRNIIIAKTDENANAVVEAMEAGGEEEEDAAADGTLQEAVSKVRDTLATVSSGPQFKLLKRALFESKTSAAAISVGTAAISVGTEVQLVKEAAAAAAATPSAEEKTKMLKTLVRVKEVVGETAKQFNLSQREVLKMASDQFKEELNEKQQRKPVQVLLLPAAPHPQLIRLPTEPDRSVVAMHKQNKSSSHSSRPPSVQLLLQSATPVHVSVVPSGTVRPSVVVAPSAVIALRQPLVQPSAAPLQLSIQQRPGPSISSRSSVSSRSSNSPSLAATQPELAKRLRDSTDEDEDDSEPADLQVQQVLDTSSKSHVLALLKLRQYKKNLKYAIWDYQDGKATMAEAARRYRMPTNVVEYSIEFILKETGQSPDEFRENKDSDVETSSRSGTSDYEDSLRRGIQLVKDRRASSLYDAARRCAVSVFDLTEKLAREVEIESRLRKLKPVEISLDSEMLSDIDEVIRDDSAKSQVAATIVASDGSEAASPSTPAAKVESNEVVQMVVEICDVCTKVFLDNAAYRDHVAAGCIDY
jgi:hypothetical protein